MGRGDNQQIDFSPAPLSEDEAVQRYVHGDVVEPRWGLHKQVVVSHPHGEVGVDPELKPLLQKLWSWGIDTRFSCQGERATRCTYISFADTRSAQLFVRAVLISCPLNEQDVDAWQITSVDHPFTDSIERLGQLTTIRFPVAQLPLITKGIVDLDNPKQKLAAPQERFLTNFLRRQRSSIRSQRRFGRVSPAARCRPVH